MQGPVYHVSGTVHSKIFSGSALDVGRRDDRQGLLGLQVHVFAAWPQIDRAARSFFVMLSLSATQPPMGAFKPSHVDGGCAS